MNDYLKALPEGYDRFEFRDFDKILEDASRGVDPMARRDRLRKQFSFAIPTAGALKAILGLGNEVVEIGAGSGYWSFLLAQRGATVHAYDNGSWSGFFNSKPWFDVRRGGPGMIRHYPSAVVLIVWPPYDRPMAFNVATRIHVGQHLVYVGEGQGGCTGNDAFFALLHSGFERVGGIGIPRWWGLHDRLEIYRREK